MDVSKLRPDHAATTGQTKVEGSKGAQQTVRSTGIGQAKEAADTTSPEKVSWSGEAQLISEGLTQAKASPDVRADKVAAIKDAIRRGTYKVDAKDVAEKMIQSSLEDGLLTRKS